MSNSQTDPQGPPTLAARLSDEVLTRAFDAFANTLNRWQDTDASGRLPLKEWVALRRAKSIEAMRAVLVAALTPEPVRLPPSVPAETWQPIDTAPKNKLVLVALIKDDKIWRVSDAKFNGLGWYTRSGEACHWRTHWAFMPSWWPHGVPTESVAPASPSAPTVGSREDDGRGLAVDMLDVDRLRAVAQGLDNYPTRRETLQNLADRLATQITETLSLRQSLREAEQARDALRTALELIRTYAATPHDVSPRAQMDSVHGTAQRALAEARR